MAQTKAVFQKMEGFPNTELGYEKGVSACFFGAADGWLYMAGGCNFPDKPVAEGGTKRYYKAIYAARLNENLQLDWKKVGELPVAAAYGVSVAYNDALLFIGGNNADGSLSSVWRLEVKGEKIVLDTLPSLPHKLDNMAGAVVGNRVFVVGGNCDGVASRRVWSLDMTSVSQGWREEYEMPGIERVQPVAAEVAGGKLGVWGGFRPKTNAHLAELALGGVLLNADKGCVDKECCCSEGKATDVSSQNDGTHWETLPVPKDMQGEDVFTGGASAVNIPQTGVLIVGGVNKDVFLPALNNLPNGYLLHEPEWYRFNDCVLLYSGGKWQVVLQDREFARAGCDIAYWDGWVYVAGGELKPGIRKADVIRLKLNP